MEPGVGLLAPHKMGIMAHTCNPSIWEGKSEEQKFKFVFNYVSLRPAHLKKEGEEEKLQPTFCF